MESLKEFFLRGKFAGAEHEGTAKHKERDALKKTQQEKHKSGGGVAIVASGIRNEETIDEAKIKLPKVDPNRTPQSHKGYSINKNLTGQHFISKDGHHISYAKDMDDAKKIIDQLTEEAIGIEAVGDIGRETKYIKRVGKEEKGTAKDKQQKSLNKAAQEGPAVSGKLELQSMGVYNEEFKVGDKVRTKKGGQIPGIVTKIDGDYVHFDHATDKRPKGLFGRDTEPKTYRVHKSNVVKEELSLTDWILDEAKKKKYIKQDDHNATAPVEMSGMRDGINIGESYDDVLYKHGYALDRKSPHTEFYRGLRGHEVRIDRSNKRWSHAHRSAATMSHGDDADSLDKHLTTRKNMGEESITFAGYILEASDTTSVPASDRRGDAFEKDPQDLARTVIQPKKPAKHPQIRMETKALKDNLTQGYQSGIGTLRSESFDEFVLFEEDRLKSAEDDLKKAETEHNAAQSTHRAMHYSFGPNHKHTKEAAVKANLARNKWQQAILNHKKLMDLNKFKKRLKSNKY